MWQLLALHGLGEWGGFVFISFLQAMVTKNEVSHLGFKDQNCASVSLSARQRVTSLDSKKHFGLGL